MAARDSNSNTVDRNNNSRCEPDDDVIAANIATTGNDVATEQTAATAAATEEGIVVDEDDDEFGDFALTPVEDQGSHESSAKLAAISDPTAKGGADDASPQSLLAKSATTSCANDGVINGDTGKGFSLRLNYTSDELQNYLNQMFPTTPSPPPLPSTSSVYPDYPTISLPDFSSILARITNATGNNPLQSTRLAHSKTQYLSFNLSRIYGFRQGGRNDDERFTYHDLAKAMQQRRQQS
ncbi:hypothetical protein EV182_004330 [Spiromyces aspiralis]|uniref:Uncharacterized protein n=1 Tax=Spiromyces aspiralis TaxID=68401 RepID=A0ACC1HBF2_9FUNG|nr:hypothetical protein EV182_004330 [Spiromyces aspiralis]